MYLYVCMYVYMYKKDTFRFEIFSLNKLIIGKNFYTNVVTSRLADLYTSNQSGMKYSFELLSF
jgi:hypothetical protein